jgi:hypothetical protein
MISAIHVGIQQSGRFCVSSCYQDEICTQNIRCKPSSYKSIDMFLGTDQDLATHVTTFLRTRLLVFQMNSSSTGFDEELRKFHHSRKAPVSCVAIRDDGREIVDFFTQVLTI